MTDEVACCAAYNLLFPITVTGCEEEMEANGVADDDDDVYICDTKYDSTTRCFKDYKPVCPLSLALSATTASTIASWHVFAQTRLAACCQ